MNDYQNGTYGLTPIGTIIQFMGTKAPNGYLFCDGSTYNITDYQEFCDFLVDQFGSVNHFGGDGVDTFAVPDLRGEFLRCTGTNGHTNEGSGDDVGVHQSATQHLFWWNGAGSQVTAYNRSTGAYSDFNGPNVQHGSYGTWVNKNYGEYAKYYTSRPTNTSVYMCIKVK